MIALSVAAVMCAVLLLGVIVVGALKCIVALEQRLDKVEGAGRDSGFDFARLTTSRHGRRVETPPDVEGDT